ncbi:hypothetical protein RFI_33562, partial [Reticulomyxa filosa]
AERVINEEQEREAAYLHYSTHEELLKTLYSTLLIKPQKQLIEQERTGVNAMVASRAIEDLNRLYYLYSLTPAHLTPIAKIVCKRMQYEGDQLLDKCLEEKRLDQLVPELVAIYGLHESIISNCFKNHPDFNKALKN